LSFTLVEFEQPAPRIPSAPSSFFGVIGIGVHNDSFLVSAITLDHHQEETRISTGYLFVILGSGIQVFGIGNEPVRGGTNLRITAQLFESIHVGDVPAGFLPLRD